MINNIFFLVSIKFEQCSRHPIISLHLKSRFHLTFIYVQLMPVEFSCKFLGFYIYTVLGIFFKNYTKERMWTNEVAHMQMPIGLTVTCIRIQFENILSSLL